MRVLPAVAMDCKLNESPAPAASIRALHRVRQWLAVAVLVGVAGCDSRETPTGPSPDGQTVDYGVLGASDGIGFGSSVPCLPFDADCPSGTGYVYLLKRRLQAEGRTVTLHNRSLPGAVLSPAIQALARDIGRDVFSNFLDDQVAFVPATTTHVTIFAGANDANVIGQAVRAGRGGSDPRPFIGAQLQQWGTDLDDLVRRLRTRAPRARIVALNLPNLAAAPYVASTTVLERSILQRIAVGISDRVNSLVSQGVLVVDLLCTPAIYDPANFSADGFHPNDRGYAQMATLTYPSLVTGTGAAPASSCPPRTLLPIF